MKKLKRLAALFLALVLCLSLGAVNAGAKTVAAPQADYIFFYAKNAAGQSVLLKVLPLSQLEKLAHGQANGENYWFSSTDNYPTTQYCEGVGFTIGELLDYVKSVSSVPGAEKLTYQGQDKVSLMTTDGYGNYTKSWSWQELYGEKRYYFEGLYTAWNTGWEVAGEDGSKTGMTLAEYQAKYQAADPNYAAKRAVFASGAESQAVLLTRSYSGRTTGDALSASTEPGIASYVSANGGKAAGCLKNALSEEYALRLGLPMTEADLMSAHRTAFNNTKWIYNLRLDMAALPALAAQGTVGEVAASFQRSGDKVTVTLSCATPGASIYYGTESAPQTLYTGPFTLDLAGQDLEREPLRLYVAGVKEGYADSGVTTVQYPGQAPAFQTAYTAMTGRDLTFSAQDGVTQSDWAAWADKLTSVTVKAPGSGGYVKADPALYRVDKTARTVTFDKSLLSAAGTYSFLFHASGYADKNASVNLKEAAPAVTASGSYGSGVTLQTGNESYAAGLSIYLTASDGSRTLVPSGYISRPGAGAVTVAADYFQKTLTDRPGTVTLEVVNNRYAPASQTVAVTMGTGFSDVPAGAWYESYVNDLAAQGVINGVGGGKFAPGGTLNWGSALKLLLVSQGYGEQAPTAAHWASGYMALAEAKGFIPAGTDPDGAISRLAFCQTAARVLGAETTLTQSPFTDTADPGVLALYEKGVINGVGNGRFAPDNTLTRAEISKIIWCIRQLDKTT